YFTEKHFDSMAKMILLTAMIVTYAYVAEIFLTWYSQEPSHTWGQYIYGGLQGRFWWAVGIMLLCNSVIPNLLWFKRIRTSIPALFVITIFINIGMWFERFVFIVVSLAQEYVPWQWSGYTPSWVELAILVGSFGWFFMFFLIFLRVLPGVSIAELKEVLPPPLRSRSRRARATGGTEA